MYAIYGLGEMGGQIFRGMLQRHIPVLGIDPFILQTGEGISHAIVSDPTDMESANCHLICVKDIESAESILFGQQGILYRLPPNTLVGILTTTTPRRVENIVSRALSLGYQNVFGAAMSRRNGQVSDRCLTLLVGVHENLDVETARQLEDISDNLVFINGAGSGMLVKLLNNYILQANRMTLLSASKVASDWGIEASQFVSAIDDSTGQSWLSSNWGINEKLMLSGAPAEPSLSDRTEDELFQLFEIDLESINRLDKRILSRIVKVMKGSEKL